MVTSSLFSIGGSARVTDDEAMSLDEAPRIVQ